MAALALLERNRLLPLRIERGAGDPQIMASGISIALMTTVIGLVVSIPLVILYAFASGAANRITQMLEEQAAGIIAEHADGRR